MNTVHGNYKPGSYHYILILRKKLYTVLCLHSIQIKINVAGFMYK